MRPPHPLSPDAASTPVPAVDLDAEADLSRCGALKDCWYVACLSSALGPGQPLARTLFGTGLVLFRDERGQPTALRDRCRPRNARLSRGAVFDGRIGRPYYGWVYDASGAVMEVPSLGPSQRSEVLDAEACALGRLSRFPTVEQDGLVFVYMGGAAPPRAAPSRVPHVGEDGWTVYFMVTRFPNGVTNLVGNFMDVPHALFVHPGWFRKPARKRVPATVRRAGGACAEAAGALVHAAGHPAGRGHHGHPARGAARWARGWGVVRHGGGPAPLRHRGLPPLAA